MLVLRIEVFHRSLFGVIVTSTGEQRKAWIPEACELTRSRVSGESGLCLIAPVAKKFSYVLLPPFYEI